MGYKGFLKANTAVTIKLGPFLDSTNGNDNETALTISQADVRLSKNGGNMAQKNESSSCTHDELGKYDCPIDTTDTNTEGRLDVTVHKSGALIIDDYYMVLSEAAYDSMFAAKDTGYMDVNIKAVSEDTTAADNLESACDNYSATRGLAGTALPAAAADAAGGLPISDAGGLDLDTMNSNVSDILTDTGTTLQAELDGIQADTEDLQAQIGTAGAGLTAVPWNAAWDAEVQSECTDALNAYDPPTKAELDTAVADVSVDEIQATALADLFNTDSGTDYASAVAGSVVKEIADNAGESALTEAGIADAVWDEARSGHVGAGSFGETMGTVETNIDNLDAAISGLNDVSSADVNAACDTALSDYDGPTNAEMEARTLAAASYATAANQTTIEGKIDTVDTNVDAVLVDTNELQTDLTNGGRLDLLIDAILADTNELQTDLANGGRLDLLIDAILADTNALQTLFESSFSEVTSKPAAGAALANKLAFLFHAAVNKATFNSSTGVHTLYQSNGSSTLGTRTLTDDGTTQTTPAIT